MIAGGLTIVIAAGAAGFLAGRATAPRPAPAPEATSPPPSPAATRSPEPPRILDRGRLIAIVDRVADLTASGLPTARAAADLAGRRFELVLPFGCDGPVPRDSKAPMRWTYDDGQKTLRVHVEARRWSLGDWGFGTERERAAPAQGFWVDRPWSSSDTCPPPAIHPAANAADPVTLPGQTLAIAQIEKTETATATLPAPRSFDSVKRIAGEQLDTSRGFRLRLTGRIDKLPNGQPIACAQPGGDKQRPVCIVAVAFDEAALESAGPPGVLATWSLGKAATAD